MAQQMALGAGAAMAAVFTAGSTAAWAQNRATTQNAPPRHFTLGPVATPGVIIAEVWEGKVTGVVDGNTLLVERENRKTGDKSANVLVRLWGVAVPGSSDATPSASAKAFVEKSVKGKRVRIQAQARAKNGDLLAEVFMLPDDKPRYGAPVGQIRDLNHPTDSLSPRPLTAPTVPIVFPNVNEGLIRAGLARWDKTGAAQADKLEKAQIDAQKNKVGLWATGAADTDAKSGAAASVEKNTKLPRRP